MNTLNEKKYMRSLIAFVINQFIEIFGADVLGKELCVIFNDPKAATPMLISNITPILIRTNCSDLVYWAQYIYQFSHELTHYVIRQYKEDKSAIIKWFEETICEAMSLYVVEKSGERWKECALYECNPDFGTSLIQYFQDVYSKTADSALTKCCTKADLVQVEQNCEENRIARSIERNYIFDCFESMPAEIQSLVYYPLFMRGDLTIDFPMWIDSDKCSHLVNRFQAIQPIIA